MQKNESMGKKWVLNCNVIMNFCRRFSRHPAILILLGMGVGAQAEDIGGPEWPPSLLPLQGESWCSITPYPQRGLTTTPLQQVEVGRPTAPQKNKEGWWIGPISGIVWGEARELVFDNSGVENQNDYLSELIWELRHAPLLGIESRWRGKKSNDLEMRFSLAIPGMPVGNMNDYDWFYTDRDWSHWSLSHVKLRWGFILDVSYEEVLVDFGHFKLKLGLGYHMDWWGWKDEIADSVYSSFASRRGRDIPDKFDQAKGDRFRDRADILSVGANAIDYWVMYHAPLLILRGSFEWDVISLSVLGRVGPALAIGKDHHRQRYEFGPRGVYFYDIAFGGPWVLAGLDVDFKITQRFLLSLQGEFIWLREMRGYTITVPTEKNAPDHKSISIGKKTGGFSFRRIGVSISALWKLGQ